MTVEEKVRNFRDQIGRMVAVLRADGLTYADAENELKLTFMKGNNAQRLEWGSYKRVSQKTHELSQKSEPGSV